MRSSRRALGGLTTASLRRWFLEHSVGNPLALSELLLAAQSARCLEERAGVWRLVGDPPLSPRLLDLVRSRLAGLDTGHRRALELVALGEPVPRVVLERLTAPRVLEELEREGVIVTERLDETWSVRTAHPILGEAVRADLPEGARVRLLEVLAEGLGATLERRADLLRIAELRLAASSPIAPETLVAAATEARRLCLHDRAGAPRGGRRDEGSGPRGDGHPCPGSGRARPAPRGGAGCGQRRRLDAPAAAGCDRRWRWRSARLISAGTGSPRSWSCSIGAVDWHAGDDVDCAPSRRCASPSSLVPVGTGDAIELGTRLAPADDSGGDDRLETGIVARPASCPRRCWPWAVRPTPSTWSVRRPSTVELGPMALWGGRGFGCGRGERGTRSRSPRRSLTAAASRLVIRPRPPSPPRFSGASRWPADARAPPPGG